MKYLISKEYCNLSDKHIFLKYSQKPVKANYTSSTEKGKIYH